MSDLLSVVPDFMLTPQTHKIVLSLEKHDITISDLLVLEQLDISKRTSISLLDLRRFIKEVANALHSSIGSAYDTNERGNTTAEVDNGGVLLGMTAFDVWKSQVYISTGDSEFDRALNGGVMTGGLTEIVGESGAGKTQILLQLCCSIQLPRSLGGLSKTAVYISTEAPISTRRLIQLLSSFRARFADNLQPDNELSTDHVFSITCGDLESQEHILNYQLPVVVEKHNVGLVVLDSVAANFRAEYDRVPNSILKNETLQKKKTGPALLAERGKQLIKMAQTLRNLARLYNIAVVVANQVSDRFEGSGRGPNSVSDGETMTLDHQSRWFTGWGDESYGVDNKVPALGLVWTNCVGARIALHKNPRSSNVSDHSASESSWNRVMKIVFAPWAEGGTVCRYVIDLDGVKGKIE
ncbi:DNA repair protein RAD57 [Tirmania nivea]|nr:DNA repair protein RAD57 [Tirmania nivea]